MWVASKSCPDNSNITSGVSPTHQLGGSTFVTAGPASFSVCCGRACKTGLRQANPTTPRTQKNTRRNRSGAICQTCRSGLFTGKAYGKIRRDVTLCLSDRLKKSSTLAAKGYEQKPIRQTLPERGNSAPVFAWPAKQNKIAVRQILRPGKNLLSRSPRDR